MNKRPNLTERMQRPQSLGGVFGGLLRAFGKTASDADLAARWGEISADSYFVGLSKGKGQKEKGKSEERTLTIRAKNPAAALSLTYRKDEFVAAVNKYFGYDAVAKVVIKK
jgi:hypothetical protein